MYFKINLVIFFRKNQFSLKIITPKNKPNINKLLVKFIFSFKKNNPNKTANKIEVSLKDETTAIGKYKHAHTTIP